MSLWRKLLFVLLALVVLLIAAGAVFVLTFDANRHRGVILGQLSAAVNRPVEAADLELRVVPLRLRLNQVRIPEAPGFAGDDFLRAQAVQFDISLWSLLRGQPQVLALELDQPTVYLRQDAAGQWNVATLVSAPAAPAAPPAAAPPAASPVRNWLLRDGTLVIERAGQTPLRLTGVELVATDLSATEAFPFRLGVNFSPESRLAVSGRLGPLDLTTPWQTPLEAEMTLENFRPAALSSLVAVPPELARLGPLAGSLKVNSAREQLSLAGNVDLLGQREEDTVKLQLTASLPADFSRVELRDTAIELGSARVSGSGSVALSPAVAFDLALGTSNTDVAGLLRIPPRLGFALPGTIPPAAGKVTADLKLAGTPQAWQLTGTAKFPELTVSVEGWKEPLRAQGLAVTLEPQRIVAAPFTLSPQAGLSLTLSGVVTDYRTQPRIAARIGGGEVPLEPLLALAARFGVKLLSPRQQLSGFVAPNLEIAGLLAEPAQMDYRGTLKFRQVSLKLPELDQPVEVASLALELDPKRLSAAPFQVALEPGLALTLAGTVDDYRGSARLKARVSGEQVPVEPLLALAARWGKNPLRKGQALSGRVSPALDLSGPLAEPARLSYQGTLAFRDLSLTTPQLPQPVRIPALELALDPARLSTQPFTARLGEKLEARATVRLDNYQTTPSLKARVETEDADLEALLTLARTLGTDPLPGGKASGRITAAVDLSGLLGEKTPPLALSGQAQLTAASVHLADVTEPFGIEQVSVEFTPSRLSATNLRATVAGTKLQGSLQVENFEAPRASFDLRGDTLTVERLQALFGAQPAAPATAPPKRRRLSLLSLPVVHAQEKSSDWFARLSGRGRLAFDRVRHGTLTVAPFAAPVVVGNQVVTCDPIEFGLYEGGGRGRLVVDLRGSEPVSEFNGLLRNVDANKLLSENSESKNRLYGRLGGTVTVRFVGSERPQVTQSAKGQGQLALVNGRLAQVSLSRELAALGQLAGLSYEQRETPIEDMTSQFEIADGWVRTDNLTLRTPDLTVEAVGGFSLEDELAFEGTATFTPEASQQMASRSPLGGLATGAITDDQGRVVVPFLVRGTFAAPKFIPDAKRVLEMKMGGGRRKPVDNLKDLLDRLRKPAGQPR